MAKIRIPETEYEVLAKLAALEESAFSTLVQAIEQEDTGSLQLNLSSRLAAKLPAIKPSDIKSFLRTVIALFSLKDSLKKTADGIVDGIIEAIEEDKPKALPLEKKAAVAERLRKLLKSGRAVELTAKAFDVMTEQDCVFQSVRVLSDMRPVFSGTPPDCISAAVIVHNLTVNYYHGGEDKRFFVALNQDDLKKVKEAIERAEKKSDVLTEFIRKTGTPLFEDKEFDDKEDE